MTTRISSLLSHSAIFRFYLGRPELVLVSKSALYLALPVRLPNSITENGVPAKHPTIVESNV